jgi:hypothetical protein
MPHHYKYQQISTVCGQNVEFLPLKQVMHIVTILLQRLNSLVYFKIFDCELPSVPHTEGFMV